MTEFEEKNLKHNTYSIVHQLNYVASNENK